MAYIGNNPKLKSIVSSGDILANLTAEPRKAGRLVWATDKGRFYYDDGNLPLNEVGAGGFNAVDDIANLQALPRVQGKIYYAQDEDLAYTDDGSVLNVLGAGVGIAVMPKGSLLTSNGIINGELSPGTDEMFLKAFDTAADGSGLEWVFINQVPTTGTTGHVLTKTAGSATFQELIGVPNAGTVGHVLTKTAGASTFQATGANLAVVVPYTFIDVSGGGAGDEVVSNVVTLVVTTTRANQPVQFFSSGYLAENGNFNTISLKGTDGFSGAAFQLTRNGTPVLNLGRLNTEGADSSRPMPILFDVPPIADTYTYVIGVYINGSGAAAGATVSAGEYTAITL